MVIGAYAQWCFSELLVELIRSQGLSTHITSIEVWASSGPADTWYDIKTNI